MEKGCWKEGTKTTEENLDEADRGQGDDMKRCEWNWTQVRITLAEAKLRAS